MKECSRVNRTEDTWSKNERKGHWDPEVDEETKYGPRKEGEEDGGWSSHFKQNVITGAIQLCMRAMHECRSGYGKSQGSPLVTSVMF